MEDLVNKDAQQLSGSWITVHRTYHCALMGSDYHMPHCIDEVPDQLLQQTPYTLGTGLHLEAKSPTLHPPSLTETLSRS